MGMIDPQKCGLDRRYSHTHNLSKGVYKCANCSIHKMSIREGIREHDIVQADTCIYYDIILCTKNHYYYGTIDGLKTAMDMEAIHG